MKKMYEAPKAEKMEFNYMETVVASDTPEPEPEQEETPTSVPATPLFPAIFNIPAEWAKHRCFMCWW